MPQKNYDTAEYTVRKSIHKTRENSFKTLLRKNIMYLKSEILFLFFLNSFDLETSNSIPPFISETSFKLIFFFPDDGSKTLKFLRFFLKQHNDSH